MSSQPPIHPQGVVLVNQIINGSLIMGLAVFLGIAVLITQDQQPRNPQTTYLALGAFAVSAIVYFVFRLPINTHQLKKVGQDQSFDRNSDEVFMVLAPTYQTERIIRLAVIEGAAFFNGMTYLTEKVWWSLAAMGLAILLMLIGFPTRHQIDAWIERQTLGLQFGDSEL
jgi:hypothetical protein